MMIKNQNKRKLKNMADIDIKKIKQDFPALSKNVHGKKLVFLDSAASAQKPKQVIDGTKEFYESEYANVHRGLYLLSELATDRFEKARKSVAKFLGTPNENEIVFTRGATEAINLVASTWGKKFLKKGDEVLISEAEHHANLVPWQMLRDEIGIVFKVFKVADDGSYIKEEFEKQLSEKTKLVAVTQMSNVLGTIFPVKEIAKKAHEFGAKVLVDGCQGAVHSKIDVKDIDCDFYVFSGHKTYGPSGIGVLYGKYDILCETPPYQYGGDMVDDVSFEKTEFAPPPAKFEAGTPAIAQAVGLGIALEYMMSIGLENIEAYEKKLTEYATQGLSKIDGLRLIGTAKNKGGVFSFVMDCAHPSDISAILDQMGVAVRVGHHCAKPIVKRMGVEATVRASIGIYNDFEDIDMLIKALEKVKKFFA
jgi:cysteine desulfurase/selenocysteine lyase